jgi:hypothetical protein
VRPFLLSLWLSFALATSIAMPIFPTVLAWDPNPPENNVVQYNVYGGYGGVLLLLGSTPSDVTTYSDYENEPGEFFYLVTAVDDQDRESGPSNEVMIVVPSRNWRIK